MGRMRARLAIPAAFLLSGFLLAASPEPQAASDSTCGAYDGKLCWQNESCASFIFFKMCTTKYKYYPNASPPGDLIE
jgi:hypothetical protein